LWLHTLAKIITLCVDMMLRCICLIVVNDMVEFDEFVEMMQRHRYLADQEAELRSAFKVPAHALFTKWGWLVIKAFIGHNKISANV
jgi:hypothetical protein